MEMLTSRDAEILGPELRRMTRAEYHRLGKPASSKTKRWSCCSGWWSR
jgi:hypothetical protein